MKEVGQRIKEIVAAPFLCLAALVAHLLTEALNGVWALVLGAVGFLIVLLVTIGGVYAVALIKKHTLLCILAVAVTAGVVVLVWRCVRKRKTAAARQPGKEPPSLSSNEVYEIDGYDAEDCDQARDE